MIQSPAKCEIVQNGDTLETISLRTNIPVCMLQRANALHPLFNGEFKEGDALIIPEEDFCAGREPCERYILDDLFDYDMLVDEDDTVFSVSSDTGVPVRLILLYNELEIGDDLPHIIYVPDMDGMKRITIMPDDTLRSIAEKYDVPEHVLMFINALTSPTIFPGQQIIVPHA